MTKRGKVWLVIMGVMVLSAGVGIMSLESKAAGPPNLEIQGRVVDVQGNPVLGAKVSDGQYADGKQYTFTDAQGNYSYKTWNEEHYVVVEAPGFKTETTLLKAGNFKHKKELVMEFQLKNDKEGISR